MKRRNTKQCLRGTEEENHGVESHKNLAGEENLEKFSFLRWPQRHSPRGRGSNGRGKEKREAQSAIGGGRRGTPATTTLSIMNAQCKT